MQASPSRPLPFHLPFPCCSLLALLLPQHCLSLSHQEKLVASVSQQQYKLPSVLHCNMQAEQKQLE